MDVSRLDAATACAETYIRSGHIPCAVLAVAGPAGAAAVRTRNRRCEEDPSLRNGIFALASITKAIVGVGIARLVEQGKLDYSDPVARHFPEFGRLEWRRAITVGDIMTHSTGLQPMDTTALLESDIGSDDEGVLRMFAEVPAYEPGKHFGYTTYTYQLFNVIVRRITGLRMPAFLTEQVFAPCGMVETGFRPADPSRVVAQIGHPADSAAKLRRFEELEVSGSGLWSSADDLIRLAQALLTPGKLLSPAVFERHTRLQRSLTACAGERRSGRTWGWNREPSPMFPHQPASGFYHGGATGTLLSLDPERQFIFVFLSSRWNSGNDHDFAALEKFYA